MRYRAREADEDTAALASDLEPVVGGLGFALVELDLYRTRKSARVRLVVTRPPDGGPGGQNGVAVGAAAGIGTDDLARLHRAVLPRLELALGGGAQKDAARKDAVQKDADLFVEVSSPGTDRILKEGAEFRHYTGRRIRCYRAGASDWEPGVLRFSDTEKILLETAEGMQELRYEEIAKARLLG